MSPMPIAFSSSGMDPYSYREYLFNPMNRFTGEQILCGMKSLMQGVNKPRGAATTAPRAETPEEKQYKQLLSRFF
jgi:hypothetical protein